MGSARHRSPRGWFVFLAVTLASALLAHAAFDIVDGGVTTIVTRPIHLLYALVVFAALAAAAVQLYHPRAAERRRLTALARAQVRRGGVAPILLCAAAQALLAASTLLLDGAQIDPQRLFVACCSTLVAIIVGALAARSVETRVLDAIDALFVTLIPERPPQLRLFGRDPFVAANEANYHLFRPKRPPPVPSFSELVASQRGRYRCSASQSRRRGRASSSPLSFSFSSGATRRTRRPRRHSPAR